jgi:type I restriction enzyme S subunit
MSFDLPDLPNGWSFASLESCSQKGSITYGIVQPGSQTSGGVPIIRVNNFRDTRIDVSCVMKVTPEIAAKYERTRLKGGEVLLTVVGTVGQVAVAPSSVAGYNVARAVAVIHPLPHVSAEWIALCLRSPFSQFLLGSRANTTVQTTINLKDLRALPIPLPPERERVSITELVGAIDDRITLLRETNTTLEAIAQALFKSWFVDFDPVHAKMQGRAPEGMIDATAALFPDSFEESELGAMPKGWRVQSLDTIAAFLNGLAIQKFPPTGHGDLPVIKIAQLRKGDSVGADQASRGIKPEYIVKNGDVLFSWSGSLEVEIWCGGEGALNQHLFKVTSEDFPKWFYFFWTRHHLADFRQTATSKATTMGHIQRGHLTAAKVCVPTAAVIEGATAVLGPIVEMLIENSLQAQTLATLRDTLLPRLISGQLRLPVKINQLGECNGV